VSSQSLPLTPPPLVQDRFHHIRSHILSSFAPSLSAFLPAISSHEQGDEGRTGKALYRPNWHWFQFRRHGCSRRHRRCARGICPRPSIILSFLEANPRRCSTSYANLSASPSVNPRYNNRINRPRLSSRTSFTSLLPLRMGRCIQLGMQTPNLISLHGPLSQTNLNWYLSPLPSRVSAFSPFPTATNQL